MVINLGDRVKFLSDTRSGIVKNITKGIAIVDVDGFDIPAVISELVPVTESEEKRMFQIMGGEEKNEVRGRRGESKDKKNNNDSPRYKDNGYGKISLESEWEDEPLILPRRNSEVDTTTANLFPSLMNQQPQEEPVVSEVPYDVTACVVKLMLVPKDTSRSPEKSDLDMYLVNDSSYKLYYSISIWKGNEYATLFSKGEIEEDMKIKIMSFQRKQMNDIIHLQVAILPFKEGKFIPIDGVDGKLELHPIKFVKGKNYVENDYFDECAVEYTLIDVK